MLGEYGGECKNRASVCTRAVCYCLFLHLYFDLSQIHTSLQRSTHVSPSEDTTTIHSYYTQVAVRDEILDALDTNK